MVKGGALANRMLLALPAESLERLRSGLRRVELRRRQVIYAAGAPVQNVYFVNRGLVSYVKSMADGRSVEVGAIGAEGAVCLGALQGLRTAILESVVQIPGSAFVGGVDMVREAMAEDDALRSLVLGYTNVAIDQIAQTAACNRLHILEERCCRWLLIAHDSAQGDEFPLTHEFLAMMLGVRRSGLSIAVSTLQKAGFIRYRRDRMRIMDRAGLEATTCECYTAIRAQFDALYSRRCAH